MKRWRLTWGGRSWTDADATAAHLVVVAELGGDDWTLISPWGSPRALLFWLIALLAAERGDLTSATIEVYGASLTDLTAALSEPDDEPAEPEPAAVG